jgi:hypothetical protein
MVAVILPRVKPHLEFEVNLNIRRNIENVDIALAAILGLFMTLETGHKAFQLQSTCSSA